MKKRLLAAIVGAALCIGALTGCNSSEVRYETTFMNYDQDVLYYNTVVKGQDAVYQGPTPTRPSNGDVIYYFNGWDKSLKNIQKDTTFIAQYTTTPTTFEITWNNYDNSLLAVTTVQFGDIPAYPSGEPSRPDNDDYYYVFNGWTPDIVAATTNATYTATYLEKEKSKDDEDILLTISYETVSPRTGEVVASYQTAPSDLGSVSSTCTYQKGTDIDLHADPYEGYTFMGWYYDNRLVSYESDYNFKCWDHDFELTARFYYTLYDFSYDTSNSNFGYASVSYSDGGYYSYNELYYTETIELNAITLQDVRFLGWFDQNNEIVTPNAVASFTMPNHEVKLIAKWNKFYITYNVNGGTLLDEPVTEYETPYENRYISMPRITREGYKFLGWFNNVTDEVVTRIDKSTLTNYRLVAQWEPISYKILYHGNGATSGSNTYVDLKYDEYYLIENCFFERTGYTFSEWNTKSDGSGTSISPNSNVLNLTNVDNTVITLYAIWTPNTYTLTLYETDPTINFGSGSVSFVTNGANETVPSQTVSEFSPLIYPGTLTRSGYAFRGWYSNSSCTNLFDFSSPVYGDITLYAGWAQMTTSNSRNKLYINAEGYTSSSSYSLSCYNTTSSYSNYVYFTAHKTGTFTIYYSNLYSSSTYGLYISIFNATQGTTIVSNTNIYTSSYRSVSASANAGDVFYVRAYNYYGSSYSTTLYLYFNGLSLPDSFESAYELYTTKTVTYDTNYTLPILSKTDYVFMGWYDAQGNQYTDGNGSCLRKWDGTSDVALFTRWQSHSTTDVTIAEAIYIIGTLATNETTSEYYKITAHLSSVSNYNSSGITLILVDSSTTLNFHVLNFVCSETTYAQLETGSTVTFSGKLKYDTSFGYSMVEPTLHSIDMIYHIVNNPGPGNKYRLGMSTKSCDIGADLFLTGEATGYYGATTTNWSSAAYFELVSTDTAGYYYLKATLANGTIKYLNTYISGNYTDISFDATPTQTYTYDSTTKTLFFYSSGHTDSSNDGTYYIGVYTRNGSTYTTARCSLISYITGSNASGLDVTQFPIHFMEL